jgi:heat shock protein HslJ
VRSIIIFLLLITAACNSSKNTSKANAAIVQEQQKINTNSKKLLDTGIDFTAEGSEPSNWRLTINYDDTVRFVSDDGLTLKIASNQLKKTTEVDKITYTATIKAGKIIISILEKNCTIPTHREVFTKEVNFLFNTILYKGCGKFLSNNLLNGKWVLEKIDNLLVDKSQYNSTPFIEFNIDNNFVNGNDGCNSFSGKMEVVGKRIQFNNLIMTQMGCSKKSIEDIISKKITNQLADYYFKEGKLYLYLIDDSILIFKK